MIGVQVFYKNRDRGFSPNNFQTVSEAIGYFDHLKETNEAQYSGEGEKEEVSQIEINMDNLSVRRFLNDLEKIGIDYDYKDIVRQVKIGDDFKRDKHITYLTLNSYQIKITKK